MHSVLPDSLRPCPLSSILLRPSGLLELPVSYTGCSRPQQSSAYPETEGFSQLVGS